MTLIMTLIMLVQALDEFEDNKEVIRIGKSKKDRQHNGRR
jgi:hypothetical protein